MTAAGATAARGRRNSEIVALAHSSEAARLFEESVPCDKLTYFL